MPTGVYIRTEQARQNMSKAKLGHYTSDATKLKLSKSHIGKFPSAESRKKMSDAKKGTKLSDETKHKISESRMGERNWNFGKDLTGKNSPAWKGGISKIDKLCRVMTEYKQWRTDIFIRDNWTCVLCGMNKCYVTVHHTKGFSKIIRENRIKNILDARACDEMWDLDNGITLCEECHSKTDNYRRKTTKIGD